MTGGGLELATKSFSAPCTNSCTTTTTTVSQVQYCIMGGVGSPSSVPKPLKVPSLARSVPKPLKVGQEGEGEGVGAKRHYALRHVVGGEVRGTTPPSQL